MRQYAIPAILLLFLIFALLQTASIKQLGEDAAALQEAVGAVVEERNDILTRERTAVVEIAEVPAPEPELAEQAAPVFEPLEIIPLDDDLQVYIWEICQQHGVPFEIVIAVIEHESGFNAAAVGYNTNGTQDSGLMQINDINRGWLAEQHEITDLLDPYQSAEAGVIILAMYWHYGPEMALTAYGWGEAGMLRSGAPSPAAIDILERSKAYAL